MEEDNAAIQGVILNVQSDSEPETIGKNWRKQSKYKSQSSMYPTPDDLQLATRGIYQHQQAYFPRDLQLLKRVKTSSMTSPLSGHFGLDHSDQW